MPLWLIASATLNRSWEIRLRSMLRDSTGLWGCPLGHKQTHRRAEIRSPHNRRYIYILIAYSLIQVISTWFNLGLRCGDATETVLAHLPSASCATNRTDVTRRFLKALGDSSEKHTRELEALKAVGKTQRKDIHSFAALNRSHWFLWRDPVWNMDSWPMLDPTICSMSPIWGGPVFGQAMLSHVGPFFRLCWADVWPILGYVEPSLDLG